MLRIFRAFAWLRWRLLMNSLERSGSRDRLERFSLAIEQLGPIVAIILMVPTALVLAGVGAVAGMAVAGGDIQSLPLAMTRYMLLAAPALVLIGPLVLPAADRTNPVRLLLLPIPRAVLYVAQSSSAFGDPWNLLAVPLILAFAAGVLAGGAVTAAIVTVASALLLIAVLIGLSSLAASLLHLIVRDRRRGELIALVFLIVLPAVSLVPAMLSGNARRARVAPVTEERTDRPWLERAGRTALSILPTEMYMGAARSAAAGDYARSARPVMGLAAMAAALHALGYVAFRRVLESPATSGGRRGVAMRDIWTRKLPGLTGAASAVALAQLRLALRTPRGRSILLSPLMVFVIFGVMMSRNAGITSLGPFQFTSGLALATFTSFIAVMSILPIAMNQFAVDRAGLTLALLSPLREEELLGGKAVGNALIVAPPALLCILAGRALFPGDPLALWITLPLGLLAVYFVAAPVAAISSAMFPRVADLNSIGRAGNPHGIANLVGMLALLIGGAIPFVLTLLATRLLDRPVLAPVFVGTWCAIAYGLCRLLFVPARHVFMRRRENLAMLE